MECKIRDINVHYDDIGEGRTLLGIHGMPTNGRIMASVCEPHFEGRLGWRRLYPDLLDFGAVSMTDWPRSPDDILDLLIEFIDAVAPGERLVVVGYSWGGYLARGVVQRRLPQIDGVMFLVPLMAWDITDLPSKQVIHHDPEVIAALQPSEQPLQEMLVVQSWAVLESIRADFMRYWTESSEEIISRLFRPFVSDPDILPEPCHAPALFVMGRQDSLVGYERAWSILDNFPRATFAVLDRAGHGLPFEQSTLWRALFSEWLDRVEEYATQNVQS